MTGKGKFGLSLAALLALGIAAAAANRTGIAEALFARAVERNVGRDQAATLPDGLHVYVCGSGSPLPDADRAGPCLAVLAGKDAFVFDAGAGSIRKLVRMGFPIDRLRAAFLTHLHSDHIDGLGELMLQAWVGGGRTVPLPIFGPPGTDKVLAGLMQAYDIDRGYRIAHHGPDIVKPNGFGAVAMPLTYAITPPTADGEPSKAIGRTYEANGVVVTVFEVNHAPIAPAYGYRIDYKGRSVTISGDTVYSPNLVTAARGTDVLFHEALNKQMVAAIGRQLAARGRRDQARIMVDILNYHASPEDAARAASEAGTKALVYYHLVPSIPPGIMERAFIGRAGEVYDGKISVSRDGMLVSLPANGEAVSFDQLL